MDKKLTRTRLRLGLVQPKRLSQSDGVTGDEQEVLMGSTVGGENLLKSEHSAGAQLIALESRARKLPKVGKGSSQRKQKAKALDSENR